MSLSNTVSKAIDDIIHTFISNIAKKYNLDPNDLLNDWEGKSSVGKESSIVSELSSDGNVSHEELLKYKKPELQALCRKRGLKCTGTKEELITILVGKKVDTTGDVSDEGSVKPTTKTKQATKETIKETSKETKAVKTELAKATPKVLTAPVLKNLATQIPTIAIRRNQFGNHEHPETSFIFDKKTKKVIGKQNSNGKIDDLTAADIEICKKMKFEFNIPKNLGSKNADSKVNELDDEEDEEFDEELEEDEAEEDDVTLDEDELLDDDCIEDGDEDGDEDFDEEYE